MITHFFKSAPNATLEVLPEPRSGVWTHVVAPGEEEFKALESLYGLEEAIVEDIKDFFEVPRFEQEGAISYFFARYPYDVKDVDIDTAPILFILGETFLITMAQQEIPFLDSYIRGKKDFSTVQKTRLLLNFMSTLTDTFERKLTRIRKMVYHDMGQVRSIRAREIQRLVFLEQNLNEIISALVPTNAWLNHLTKGNYIQMFADDREVLEDLLIDNSQLIDVAKSILKTIQNIRSASDALLTQNLNHTIRMLTAFTIVLTIPTLVSSLFGMNVQLPLQEHSHAFWLIIVFIITAVALVLHFFMKNRWI